VHTDERPFLCDTEECSSRFRRESHLINHFKRRHNLIRSAYEITPVVLQHEQETQETQEV
jgi:hypothetical protein